MQTGRPVGSSETDSVLKTKKRRAPVVPPTERLKRRIQELEADLKTERAESFRFSVLCAVNAAPARYRATLLRAAVRNRRDLNFADLCARQLELEALTGEGTGEAAAARFVRDNNTPYYARGIRELIDLDSRPVTPEKAPEPVADTPPPPEHACDRTSQE